MLTKIDQITFTAPLVDNSGEVTPIGTHQSTMTLYDIDGDLSIEWHILGLDEVYEIGLWFENKVLVDYDGLYNLPKEAVALLVKNGYTVPEDF